MTNLDNTPDRNPTHDIVPSNIAGRMDQMMNSALAAERLVMSPEVREHLNGILDLYNGQVFRELDTVVRQEVVTAETRSSLQGLQGQISGETPRDLTQSILGQERLITTRILEKYEVIARTTARLISHIAASESTMLTRTDGQNGYGLTENTLSKVALVLVNLTDYVATPGITMTIVNNLVTNPDLSPEDGEYILWLLDNTPNAFQMALNGTMDEFDSHGNTQQFNEAATLVNTMSQPQLEALITIAIDSYVDLGRANRLDSIKQLALYTSIPIARVEALINQKIAELEPTSPYINSLASLRDDIVQAAPIVAAEYQAALQEMASMNPDVFRILNPTSFSRIAGFAMSYWGAATLFANLFLALAQKKPEYILKNIGTTVIAGTVARVGGELASGNPNPLGSLFSSFTSELAINSDNREALRQRNWAQIINDNLLSEVGGETLALWSDDRFINVLNSMGTNTPEDRLIRFNTASFTAKLDQAGLGDRYRELYGDNFLDNPIQEETKLNLLANAYRGLGIRDHTTFMTYAALPFGLTDQDIQAN